VLGATIALAFGWIGVSAASAANYTCNDDRYLNQHDGTVQKPGASWGKWITSDGKKIRTSCGFVDGQAVRLGSLALFQDRTKADSFVWVYRGIGNSCSQLELLILNEVTQQVTIFNVSTAQKQTYQCARD